MELTIQKSDSGKAGTMNVADSVFSVEFNEPLIHQVLTSYLAGTIRSPIWRGGGITFAAKPRDHSKKLNKKMYRAAMRSILSELVRQERFICIDEFNVDESKTKLVKDKLASLSLDDVLIVTEELNENLYLGVRNIPKVDVIDTNEIDPYSLIGFDKVLMTQAAVEKVEAWLS